MGYKSKLKQQRRELKKAPKVSTAQLEEWDYLFARHQCTIPAQEISRLNLLYPQRITGINWGGFESIGDAKEIEILAKLNVAAYDSIECKEDTEHEMGWDRAFHQYPLRWVLMKTELDAIEARIPLNWEVSPYQWGQVKLFKALLKSLATADYDIEGVIESGRSLHESGGDRDMRDALTVWTPKECHRMVDVSWNGIGGWRA